MTEAEALLVVLTAIYLVDCATWQRNDVVAFAQPWLGRWNLKFPGWPIGNANSGAVMGNPFPPLGALALAQPLPMSISADGVYTHVAQNLHPAGWPEFPGGYFPWDRLRGTLRVDGPRVYLGEKCLATTMSPAYAQWLTQQLEQLASVEDGDREAAIERLLAEIFSVERAISQRDALRRASLGVLIRGNVLLVSMLGSIGAFLWWEPAILLWPAIALILLLQWFAAVLGFRGAHRRLFPTAHSRRRKQLLRLIVSPLSLVRAADLLGQDAFVGLHPLALAAALLDREALASLARRTLADMLHPCPPACPSDQPEANVIEAWYRQQLQQAAGDMLMEQGIDLHELLAPPAPEGEEIAAYCPRCRMQFETNHGECVACGGIPLASLARAT